MTNFTHVCGLIKGTHTHTFQWSILYVNVTVDIPEEKKAYFAYQNLSDNILTFSRPAGAKDNEHTNQCHCHSLADYCSSIC